MTPQLSTSAYSLPGKGKTKRDLLIKKKDYGDMVLYDVFFERTFLFTISKDGIILLSNWEAAHQEPVCLNDKELKEISLYIAAH